MAAGWFVMLNGKVHGPFDGNALRALAAAAKIAAATPVSQQATGPWTRADAVRGLFPGTLPGGVRPTPAADRTVGRQAAPPPLPPPPSNVVAASSAEFGEPAAVPIQSPVASPVAVEDRPQPSKAAGGKAAIWGAIGGIASLAVILLNVVFLFNRVTDRDAVQLIKSSMQETFAKDARLAKPVQVRRVNLRGKGVNRTGTAEVTFGGVSHTIPFTVTLNRSGDDLKVDWRTDQLPIEAPVASPTPARPTTPQRASPPLRPPAATRPAANPQLDRAAGFAEFQKQHQALVLTISEIDTLEIQLSNENAPLTFDEETAVLRKLAAAWMAVNGHAKALRELAMSAAPADSRMPREVEKMIGMLVVLESSVPAVIQALTTAIESTNESEVQASMATYWNLSEGLGEALTSGE